MYRINILQRRRSGLLKQSLLLFWKFSDSMVKLIFPNKLGGGVRHSFWIPHFSRWWAFVSPHPIPWSYASDYDLIDCCLTSSGEYFKYIHHNLYKQYILNVKSWHYRIVLITNIQITTLKPCYILNRVGNLCLSMSTNDLVHWELFINLSLVD